MIGAVALLETLTRAGVDVTFGNPGTSEMHFVAALDSVPGMRGVLALDEGVVTGAADGYGRMAGTPAATLLHLGPGLGNGLANLHNARRARTPIVNVVGDHALTHKALDAPLESDIDALAETVSVWTRRTLEPEAVGIDTADAVAAAMWPPGGVATLILPADVSWGEGGVVGPDAALFGPSVVGPKAVEHVAGLLRSGGRCGLLVGGGALRGEAPAFLHRISEATGAKVFGETFSSRTERGAGRPEFERINYRGPTALEQLSGLDHLVLVEAKSPVAFFGYPEQDGSLVPEGTSVHQLAPIGADSDTVLAALAEELGAPEVPVPSDAVDRTHPDGALDVVSFARAVAATMPDDAIVSDEATTSGIFLGHETQNCPPHDWMMLTGGAIGQGMPLATGAAVACPDRPVLNVQADGSAMYTIQSLWTQAREDLNVTTVLLNNQSYAVLNLELQAVGAVADGTKALSMLDLRRPDLDFVSISQGMGVPAVRVDTADGLSRELERAYAEPGPHLIEAMIPSIVR